MADTYPQVTELRYEDFASVDCTVTRNEPLNGNSGSSTVRVQVHAGHIALDDEMMKIAPPQDFTIHLVGESEHRVLASLFRDVAAVLDRD
jgi:hypothetical protein